MPYHQSPPPAASQLQPSIVCNPDGTYTRLIHFPCTPATPDHDHNPSPVLSKDIVLNPKHQTWLRIYLPRQALDSSSSTKFPLIVYYHGGAFVFLSAASTKIHHFCAQLAARLQALIVSVEYRLAPEHRLPAAYHDAVEALHCIRTTQERWLTEFADCSKCFLMGTSAGGNIAYHAGLRAAPAADDLQPLKIRGLVLHHPFFGGPERTGSELRLADDPFLPPSGCDLMWELSLPVGADRGHKYCNPTVDGGSDGLELIGLLGWRILVTGCHGDPLIDRQMELAKMLMGKGVQTVAHFSDGYHGMEISEPSKAEELFVILRGFLSPDSLS